MVKCRHLPSFSKFSSLEMSLYEVWECQNTHVMLGLACSYMMQINVRKGRFEKIINLSCFCAMSKCDTILPNKALLTCFNCRNKYKILKVNLHWIVLFVLNYANRFILWGSFIPYKSNCFLHWSLTVCLLRNYTRSYCSKCHKVQKVKQLHLYLKDITFTHLFIFL